MLLLHLYSIHVVPRSEWLQECPFFESIDKLSKSKKVYLRWHVNLYSRQAIVAETPT